MMWVVGDVETSGLGPGSKVVEVALAEIDDNLNVRKAASSLINPEIPISPSASGVHGITNAHVADKPTIEEFFAGEGHFLNAQEATLIAHNAAFDMGFLGPHIPGLTSTLCTLKLARIIFPDAENHKLQTLRYTLGLDDGDAHSAAGDVTVLLSLLRVLSKESGLDLHGLLALSKQPIVISKMPFGKHRGTALTDLPKNYVKWLFGLQDLDENLRFSLEAIYN